MKTNKPRYDWYKKKAIGVDDKHGNPIKEGDIVMIRETNKNNNAAIPHLIQYSEELCAFTLHAFLLLLKISPDSHNVSYEFEIIGTIDENPELL